LPIECNPRYNGSSYPTNIAEKLGAQAWIAKNFKTSFTSLDQIDLKEWEYDPQTGRGAVIVNWGVVGAGKLGILIIGTEDEQVLIEERLNNLL
jgi:hypothetical protein